MEKHIYKITNIVNNKVYVGQTKDLIGRWQKHKGNLNNNNHYNIYLQRSWNKYGEENFKYEPIIFTENYNEEEIKNIKLYNATNPKYGYNVLEGGDEPPIIKGEDSLLSNHTLDEINNLKDDLKHSALSKEELADKYNYSISGVNRVNNGKAWKDEDENYPLRVSSNKVSPTDLDYIIDQLLNTEKSQTDIGKEVGLKRSAITMINVGKNNKIDGVDYPIRKTTTVEMKKEKLDKNIIEYILGHKDRNLREISNVFNVCPSLVSDVNSGKIHKYEGYLYPIREIIR